MTNGKVYSSRLLRTSNLFTILGIAAFVFKYAIGHTNRILDLDSGIVSRNNRRLLLSKIIRVTLSEKTTLRSG